jgi:hypothetical protein
MFTIIKKICDSIGYFSPLLFCLITIISLTTITNSKNLYIIYLFGLVINRLFNIFLKKYVFYQYNKGLEHNMPSGHFQSMSYSFVFYILNIKNIHNNYLFLFLLIALCTFYNCIHYKYHTYSEIIVGIFIGSLLGYIFTKLKKL